jgi:hypothetical protein
MLEGNIEPTEEWATPEPDAPDTNGKTKRIGRSEMPFPYVHLEESITIPRAIFENGARTLSREQLAGALGVSPGSGSFSLKLGSARLFGLTESSEGRYQLTRIGELACSTDSIEAQAGRRDAFLAVELYRRVFNDYRGKLLPPTPKAMEQALLSYGVAERQVDKCRQTLMRSATFAGFFASGRDRLIEPIIGIVPPPPGKAPVDDRIAPEAKTRMIRDVTPLVLDETLIKGMLERLPKPGAEWSQEKRTQWLTLFSSVLDMVYPTTAASPDGQH